MEWIKVTDSMPKEEKDYLVTDGEACMVCKLKNGIFHFWTIHWWKHTDVTHWMEIPKTPNENN